MFVEAALNGLQARIEILERVIEIFTGLLPAPSLQEFWGGRGFRFEKPDVRHFCLLKAVRIVSALNAATELSRLGYTQEMASLMRIVSECTRHIEYVVDVDDDAKHQTNVQNYLRDFFADTTRDVEAEIKGVLIREKLINEQLGKTLDKIAALNGEVENRTPAAKLFHRSARAISFYVHARYPECMDLYGGRPGWFHLRGMRGTTKDRENLEILDTFITTANTTFVIMVQALGELREAVFCEPALARWYSEKVG